MSRAQEQNRSAAAGRAVASSGIPARGMARHDRAGRRTTSSRSYPWRVRAMDWFHGHLDARKEFPGPVSAMPWVDRLQATYREETERERVGTQDALVDQIRELQSLTEQLKAARRAATEVQSGLESMAPREVVKRHGEAHQELTVSQARAARADAADRSRAAGALGSARGALADLDKERAQLVGVLNEEWGVLVGSCERRRGLFVRRLETYRRRYVRTRPDAVNDKRPVLELPDWAGGENPWIPRAGAVPEGDAA